MASIFLSHSSKDKVQARQLKEWLESDDRGHWIFFDDDIHSGIKSGEEWERALYKNLRLCPVFLPIFTQNWVDSKWCFAEMTHARASGKLILPVKLDPTFDTSDLFSDLQHTPIDLSVNDQSGYQRLNRALQEKFPWPPVNDPDRAPYPGLAAFQKEDAAIYKGRDPEIISTIETLEGLRQRGPNAPHFVLLLGASGSGKSSLVRAGLIPRLRLKRGWLILSPFRPLLKPISSMAETLSGAFKEAGMPKPVSEIEENLIQAAQFDPPDGSVLLNLIRELRIESRSQNDTTLLLNIDQGEELFAPNGRQQTNLLLGLLRNAIEEADGHLMVLVTIRSEFLGTFQEQPFLLAPHYGKKLFQYEKITLDPLPIERFREIINEPAELAGLVVDNDLVERMVADTGTRDALPLLAYTLRRLWDNEDYRKDSRFELDEYKALGRLEGSIRKAADEALDAKNRTTAELHIIREAFVPAMVSLTPEGSPVRRRVRQDKFLPAVQKVLKPFIEKRLLVTDYDSKGRKTIEVAHEALLRVWPQLVKWLENDRDKIFLFDGLYRASQEWQYKDENADLLLHRGDRLREVIELVRMPRFSLEVDSSACKYLNYCNSAQIEQKKKEKDEQEFRIQKAEETATLFKQWFTIAGVLLLLVVGATYFAFVQKKNAVEQKEIAIVEAKNAKEQKKITAYQLGKTNRNNGITTRDKDNNPLLAAHFFISAAEAFGSSKNLLASANALLAGQSLTMGIELVAVLPPSRPEDIPFCNFASLSSELGIKSQFYKNTFVSIANVTGLVHSTEQTFELDCAVIWESKDQRILLAVTDTGLKMWDRNDNPSVPHLVSKQTAIEHHQVSSNGQWILTKTLHEDELWSNEIWSKKTGKTRLLPLKFHDKEDLFLGFTKNGSKFLLMSGVSQDGFIQARLWDTVSLKPVSPPLAIEKSDYFWERSNNMPGHSSYDARDKGVLSDNGKRVLTLIAKPNGVAVWDSEQDKLKILPWKQNALRIWDARTNKMVTWEENKTIEYWGGEDHPNSKINLPSLPSVHDVENIKLSGDGMSVLMSGNILLKEGELAGKLLWKINTEEIFIFPINESMSWRFSPSLRRFLFVKDKVARLYSIDKWEPMTEWFDFGHRSDYSVNWSERYVVVKSSGNLAVNSPGRISLWNTDNGHLMFETFLDDRMPNAEFSNDGKRFILWNDVEMQVWDTEQGLPIATSTTLMNKESHLIFNEDNTHIFESSPYQTRIWRIKPVTRLLQKAQGLKGAEFDSKGDNLLTWGEEVLLLDIDTDIIIRANLPSEITANRASFTQDDTRVLIWGNNREAIWNIDNQKTILLPDTKIAGTEIDEVKFGVDDHRIFSPNEEWNVIFHAGTSGSGRFGPLSGRNSKGFITIVNTKTQKKYYLNNVTSKPIFNNAGNRMMFIDYDGGVRVWNSAQPDSPPKQFGTKFDDVLFSPNNQSILTLTNSQMSRSLQSTIQLWNSNTGQPQTPPFLFDGSFNGNISFSATGTHIFLWSDTRAWVLDSDTGKMLLEITHPVEIVGAEFNSSGNCVLVWGETGAPILWDLANDDKWPHDKLVLKLEVESGTKKTDTDQLSLLSQLEWAQKKYCEYDVIQRQIGHIPNDIAWAKSQELCRTVEEVGSQDP